MNVARSIDGPQMSKPAASILVIGAGVFGLSTFHELLLSKRYDSTDLILLDPYVPSLSAEHPRGDNGSTNEETSQNVWAASIDSSRIVRAEYANPAYARLAAEAQEKWRQGFARVPSHAVRRVSRSGSNARGSQESRIGGISQNLAEESLPDVYQETGIVIAAGSQGNEYMTASKRNSEKLGYVTKPLQGTIAIRDAVGLPKLLEDEIDNGSDSVVGVSGYSNDESGWVNSGKAMAALMTIVLELAEARNKKYREGRRTSRETKFGKVECIRAAAERLIFAPDVRGSQNGHCVKGAILTDGRRLAAEHTILAAGAWSSALIDMRGRACATGQVLGYITLSDQEAHQLRHLKILLNFSSGMFFIPPVKLSNGWEFKVARHGYGYTNPVRMTQGPEPGQESAQDFVVSLPDPNYTNVPPEGRTACREYLARLVPWLANRPFDKTRICWYTDTPTGDFIIDHHPKYPGLMLATGGSGHAFKFLPVIGRKIVDVFEGIADIELKTLWKWRASIAGAWATQDGSRGSKTGMILSDERAKAADVETIKARM